MRKYIYSLVGDEDADSFVIKCTCMLSFTIPTLLMVVGSTW